MSKSKSRTKLKKIAVIFICTAALFYFLIKNITSSVFLQNKDKVNIVFYGEISRLYSLEKKGLDYFITFAPQAEVLVPGGYGNYKIGALNKLATLDKNPDLIRKAFSAGVSAMVDIYFYPKLDSVFYNDQEKLRISPTIGEIFFNPGNANFVDRLYIFATFIGKTKNSYKEIDIKSDFNHESFVKKNMGIFYNRTYRNSRHNVQVIYSKDYRTARMIGEIMQGGGIRVVDITRDSTVQDSKRCEIITSQDKINSAVVQAIKHFFKCNVKRGEVSVSDIIFKLGSVESEWSAN